jgi:hypothetical protein
VQAIQSAGAKAMQTVLQDSLARAQALKDAATDLQSRGEAAVRQLTQAAATSRSALEDAATKAVARVADVQEFLLALATAQADAAEQAETDAAQLALGKLAGLEQAQVAKVTKAGLALASSTGKTLQAVGALVAQVGTSTSAQVEKDIAYVAKVSGDYAKVPTGPRIEKADAWALVAGLANGRLEKVLTATGELDSLADQVLQAAQAAKAQIEGMA